MVTRNFGEIEAKVRTYRKKINLNEAWYEEKTTWKGNEKRGEKALCLRDEWAIHWDYTQ